MNDAEVAASSGGFVANLFRRIIALRWAIVVFYALFLIPAAYFATKVGQDNSVDRIIGPNDPEMKKNVAFGEVFGTGEVAILILEADDPLSPAMFERVNALEQGLDKVPRVHATSVITPYRLSKPDFDVGKEAPDLKTFATGTKLFREQGLIGDHFQVVVNVLDVKSRAERDETLDAMEKVIADVGTSKPPVTALHRVGKPYVNHYFDESQQRSGPKYFGLFMGFVVVLVLALFRSVRTLIAFLVTLAVCLCACMGFVGVTKGVFTLVSPMVPMTILITATATLVYLHSRYAERPPGVGLEQHHIFALSNKFVACTASIFAAVVGFLALLVSDMQPIREMGMWVGVGLALVWLIVLTLFPALQRILNTPTHVERPTAATWFHSIARGLPRFSYRYRWLLVGASVLLSTAGVISVFGLKGRIAPMSAITEPIEYVSRDTDVYRDTDFARKYLPGLSVTNVWIKTDKKELLVEPEILEGLHDFEERLSKDPEVGAVVGLPKFLRIMRYTTHEGDAWPEDADELTETLETLGGDASKLPPQMKLAQEALKPFINITSGQNQTQFTVVSNAREHESYDHLKSRIEFHWAEMVKTHPALDPDKQKDPAAKITIETVGLGPLQAKMSRSLVPTLIQSFALTAGIIFITFLILFRSGAARIMTMVPSLFAILVMFLAMRVAGMGANIATILIASTVLGTSENDQIHFFYHFSEGRKRGTVTQALEHTFLVSGKAIFFATIINAGGFLAFAVSDLRPMRQFGALTALALVLSMIADFTALPAALWIVFRAKLDPPAKSSDAPPAGASKTGEADGDEPQPSSGPGDDAAEAPEAKAGEKAEGAKEASGPKSASAEPESPPSS